MISKINSNIFPNSIGTSLLIISILEDNMLNDGLSCDSLRKVVVKIPDVPYQCGSNLVYFPALLLREWKHSVGGGKSLLLTTPTHEVEWLPCTRAVLIKAGLAPLSLWGRQPASMKIFYRLTQNMAAEFFFPAKAASSSTTNLNP